MFFIYGSQSEEVDGSSGDFFCPKCSTFRTYQLKQTRTSFTVFFVPIGNGSAGPCCVECTACGTRFEEAVLEYQPPSEEGRLRFALEKRLRAGVSIGKLQAHLQEAGYDAEGAESMLLSLCDKQPKRCECGRRYHPLVFRCDDCGIGIR